MLCLCRKPEEKLEAMKRITDAAADKLRRETAESEEAEREKNSGFLFKLFQNKPAK